MGKYARITVIPVSGASATLGRSVPNGVSGSFGINGNIQLGRVAAGVGATLIAREGPGLNGVSFGLSGGGGMTINANFAGRGGYGGQIVPGCKISK